MGKIFALSLVASLFVGHNGGVGFTISLTFEYVHGIAVDVVSALAVQLPLAIYPSTGVPFIVDPAGDYGIETLPSGPLVVGGAVLIYSIDVDLFGQGHIHIYGLFDIAVGQVFYFYGHIKPISSKTIYSPAHW